MAGRRRQGGGAPPRPLLRDVKAERRRARLAAELGVAATPRERITVAVDFVRAAMATGRTPADQEVRVLVTELIGAGDQLWAARRRARLAAEMAAAEGPRDELQVALEYVRRALAGAQEPAVQAAAAQVVEPLVRRLVAAGDDLTGAAR
jgi:hypothetical protein